MTMTNRIEFADKLLLRHNSNEAIRVLNVAAFLDGAQRVIVVCIRVCGTTSWRGDQLQGRAKRINSFSRY